MKDKEYIVIGGFTVAETYETIIKAKNKEDIFCPYENLTPYKKQRVCRYFEQAGDDNKNEFECANCLIGRTSSMLCELKMTKKQVEYWN